MCRYPVSCLLWHCLAWWQLVISMKRNSTLHHQICSQMPSSRCCCHFALLSHPCALYVQATHCGANSIIQTLLRPYKCPDQCGILIRARNGYSFVCEIVLGLCSQCKIDWNATCPITYQAKHEAVSWPWTAFTYNNNATVFDLRLLRGSICSAMGCSCLHLITWQFMPYTTSTTTTQHYLRMGTAVNLAVAHVKVVLLLCPSPTCADASAWSPNPAMVVFSFHLLAQIVHLNLWWSSSATYTCDLVTFSRCVQPSITLYARWNCVYYMVVTSMQQGCCNQAWQPCQPHVAALLLGCNFSMGAFFLIQ